MAPRSQAIAAACLAGERALVVERGRMEAAIRPARSITRATRHDAVKTIAGVLSRADVAGRGGYLVND